MSSETKSREGRTAEQVVNEWRESGSQDWGQLVSAINYWAVTDMCPALESSSSAGTGGREAAYHARGAGREDATLQFRITGYLADNDSLTDEQLSDLLRDCRSAMGEIVLANRCMFHRNIPPMNKVCADGAECPICAQHNPPDRRLVREPGADPGTTPLHEAAIDLLNHIENILDDENFDKIDSKLWNRVTGLAAAERGTTGAEGLSDELKRISQSLEDPNASRIIAIVALDSLRNRLLAATQRAPVTPPAPWWMEGAKLIGTCVYRRTENGVEVSFERAAPAPVTTPGRDEALTTAILARKLNASGHSNASFAHGYTTACDDILKALLAAKEPRG